MTDPHPSGPAAATQPPGERRAAGGVRRVAAAVAVALLVGFGVLWLTRPSEALSGVPEAPPVAGAVAATGARTPVPTTPSAPSETPSGSVRAHPATPAPADPRPAPTRFTIRGLGIDLPVLPVGVAPDGEMALPPTPAQMGWYSYGPRPGDPGGATVLAAHLDMPGYGTGPIAAIDGLEVGDVVTVRSAATTTRYAVTDVRSIEKSRLDLAALFTRDGEPVLHVVTCGGTFDPERRRYDRNVVVTATPLS
jgi:hypothetical protein